MNQNFRVVLAAMLSALVGFVNSNVVLAEEFAFPSHKKLTLTWTARATANSDGTFSYFYKFRNSRTSQQPPDFIWLAQLGDVKPKILNPPLWTSGAHFLRQNASVVWGVGGSGDSDENPIINGVNPGQTSPEFGIIDSPYPPGINDFLVRGYAPAPVYDEARDVIIVEGKEFSGSEWASRIMDSSTELPNGKIEEDGVSGFTLGPRTPDADPCQFLTTLGLDVIKAGEIGWIKPSDPALGPKSGEKSGPDNAPTAAPRIHLAEGLAAKILNVRTPCQKGQYEPASRLLSAVLYENCALRGQQINEEAYLLIRYNVEYLLEKFGHPELAPSCEVPTGSLAVHVTKKGVKGGVVNAQGIEVTVTSKDGAIVRSGKTGWGASSGEAVFDDLPSGEYTVKANGKTTRAIVEKGKATEAEVGP